MKEPEKCKKILPFTEFNVPNGSWDIPLQSQKSEQDGRRHFEDFQPHFHINMTLPKQSKYDVTLANEKMKVQYLRSLLFDLFEIFQLLKLSKGILLDFNFSWYGNQN